jgi:hypothetical protein
MNVPARVLDPPALLAGFVKLLSSEHLVGPGGWPGACQFLRQCFQRGWMYCIVVKLFQLIVTETITSTLKPRKANSDQRLRLHLKETSVRDLVQFYKLEGKSADDIS